MVKVILENEDVHFEEKAECAPVITITSDSEKIYGNAIYTRAINLGYDAYVIGKGVREILNDIAGENTIERVIVLNNFIRGLFDGD